VSAAPRAKTLGELRASGWRSRGVREELRANLVERLRAGRRSFEDIHGYDDTVVPAVERALLCGHDLVFLGERGQAKSRMIRSLANLLDEWIPQVAGSEVRDDPFAPVSARAKDRLAREGDACPIEWVHRSDRFVEKLATPDTSVADLIGDVDPARVAEGRSLSDELTLHFGLIPRSNRGIFCVNELPDLSEKVQVGLFDIMEERDVQVKGYRVRLPLDVLIVASANPEDYTSRGRIVTPLKDRYSAQIRTHYPRERELELAIVRQEAELPELGGVCTSVPDFMQQLVAELTFQARSHPDVNQASGVSVRMSVANYETLVAAASYRALRLGEREAVPRISDLPSLQSSTSGKLELEYAGAERSDSDVFEDLCKRAVKRVFDELVVGAPLDALVKAFEQGWKIEVGPDLPSAEYLQGLDELPGLREAASALAKSEEPAQLASAIEFVLEGLHLSNRLNKQLRAGGAVYARG
jgi:magnesium chelatase subunit I